MARSHGMHYPHRGTTYNPCGSLMGYSNRKCRCNDCKEAKAVYQRLLKARWSEKNLDVYTDEDGNLPVEISHNLNPAHGVMGFVNGCRCDHCNTAAAPFKVDPRVIRRQRKDAQKEQDRLRIQKGIADAEERRLANDPAYARRKKLEAVQQQREVVNKGKATRKARRASPDGIPHGTPAAYNTDGCRCELCTAFMSEYRHAQKVTKVLEARKRGERVRMYKIDAPERERRAAAEREADRLAALSPDGKAHGSPREYLKGCRCSSCRAAGRVRYLGGKMNREKDPVKKAKIAGTLYEAEQQLWHQLSIDHAERMGYPEEVMDLL